IWFVVRTSPSSTGYPAESGSGELSWGGGLTQLGVARYCETCRNAVNAIFRRQDVAFRSPQGNDKMIITIGSRAPPARLRWQSAKDGASNPTPSSSDNRNWTFESHITSI